jgi:hypothetical protein
MAMIALSGDAEPVPNPDAVRRTAAETRAALRRLATGTMRGDPLEGCEDIEERPDFVGP